MKKTVLHNLKTGFLLATGLLPGISEVHAQQVYKWTDDKGALHYTQTPPPAKPSQSLNIKTRPAPATAPATTNGKAASTTDAKANNASAPQPQAAPKLNMSKESCQQMQKSLDTLQSGRRVYESDKNGERAYLSEEDKAARIQTYSQTLAKGCS